MQVEVGPAGVLRTIAKDLRERKPKITVGDFYDRVVMSIVEDGRDWRDLTPKRQSRYQQAAE